MSTIVSLIKRVEKWGRFFKQIMNSRPAQPESSLPPAMKDLNDKLGAIKPKTDPDPDPKPKPKPPMGFDH